MQQRRVFLEPMKGRRIHTEVERFLVKPRVLERGVDYLQRLIRVMSTQKIREAPIRLYDD